jgi:hypothetical protein
MQKIRLTRKVKKQIVKQAVKEKNFAGMYMMGLLPKSCDKMKNLEVEIESEQQLRSLATLFKGRQFMVFFLDGLKKKLYACLWELVPEVNQFGGPLLAKGIWKGFMEW